MDDLHKMQDDLEKVIEKDDTSSTVTGSDCEETFRHGPLTVREKLDAIIHSRKFQVGVVALVVLDVIVVIVELLLDVEIVKLKAEHRESVPKVFHYLSIAILSIFLVEISLRIFVMRLQFFRHKLEVFDAVIVIASFILDIVFRNNEDATTGAALLIVLRLWRVVRIFNGIIMQFKNQTTKKVEKEKQLREACEQELKKFRAYCTSLEGEIDYLHRLLKEHNIPFTEKVQKRPEEHQICVQAEVNHKVAEEGGGETNKGATGTEQTAGGVRRRSTEEEGVGVGVVSRAAVNGLADSSTSEGGRRMRRVGGDSREVSDIITLESTVAVS